MATDHDDSFHGFGSRPAGTITTITSDNNHKRVPNRHSLLPFRHVSSSSEEDGGSATSSIHSSSHHRHSRRFQHGLKLLDLTAKTRGGGGNNGGEVPRRDHVRSQASQGSGSGTEAAAASPSGSATSFPAMTKEEFEALPPTIRRKYFSTLERLRFAQDPEYDDSDTTPSASLDNLPKLHPNINPAATTTTTTNPSPAAAATGRSFQDKNQPVRLTVLSKLPSEAAPLSSPRRPRSALIRLHSSPVSDRQSPTVAPHKLGLGILHNKSDDLQQHPSSLSFRHSVILDATDEALIKRGKRQANLTARQNQGHLHRAASFDHLSHRMHTRTSDSAWMDGRIKATEDSLYDSFRWLEDEGDLDLSLDLDEYHSGLREDVVSRKSRSSSIRRKLSISSKVAFGRASSTLSRPTTKEASTPFGGSVLSLQNPSGNGHVRRRSRALSLMSSKQPPSEVTTVSPPAPAPAPAMDPAAHYQDPEARMKLRVYLASPHKFDEAVEFGFPSTEQQPQSPQSPDSPPRRTDSLTRAPERGGHLRMQTLVEDKRCSLYSDETTATESDSPRTPDTLDRPSAPFAPAADEDREAAKVDYAQAHAYSREMTLRMTLTRPDLRANENQIYGWQQKNGRPTTSDGPRSPVGPKSEDDLKKDSIERQLAAIDQENMLYPEQSSMKRFWNRVRRT